MTLAHKHLRPKTKRQTRKLAGSGLRAQLVALAGPEPVAQAAAVRISAAMTEARFKAAAGRVSVRAAGDVVRSRFLVDRAATAPETPAATPAGAQPAPTALPAAEPKPGPKAFDPYAFSVVAMLRKSGRDQAVARLAAIPDVADLRRLAEVQHLALPQGLTTAVDIRAAIIASAERRIADRRAAAG